MLDYFSPPLVAYAAFVLFLLGASMGSFVNCFAWRYINGESVVHGRSHCTTCQTPLGVLDLIPVFSWLFLRGRCRHCSAPISPRYMLVELFGGLLYVAVFLRYGFTLPCLWYLILVTLLLPAALIDLDAMILPDGLTLAGAILYALSLFFAENPLSEAIAGGVGALVLGGGILALTLLMEAILKKEAMGGGDIKLLAMLGLWVHVDGGLLLLIVACFLGLLLARLLAAHNRPFPFGPAIIAAAFFVFLFGKDIITWYLSFFL